MKNKTEILDIIGRDRRYKGYCYRYSGNKDAEEIYSHFLLKICEKDGDKLVELYEANQLHKYCVRMITVLITAPSSQINYTSKFAPDFCSYVSGLHEVQENRENYSNIDQSVDIVLKEESYWFNPKMWYLYVENDCNMAEVSRKTGIPVYTIRNWLNYMKEKFKKKYEELCSIS